MYSKNKYCKNSRNQKNNFRIVYTDLFKCPTYFAKLNLLKMTVVMVEISINKMEINILNIFFTKIFVSPCVYILKISNMLTRIYIYIYNSSSSSSSSRTDRWVHFQQNAGLRLFVHTWIVHGIDDCYQLTQTFGGFSAQCLSKLFLKEFTVLLLTTSLGRAFQVVVMLIG